MKKIKQFFIKPISWIEMSIYVFIFTGMVIYVFISLTPKSNTPFVKKEKIYETITPKISKTFSTQKLIGKVSSNEFAMIHPRREGIIKDILVDIGDEVTAGKTIAYLFPPGVEGEGATEISKAKAQLLSAQEDFRNAKSVAGESVEVAEKKLSQTETSLKNIIGNGENRSQITQNYDEVEIMALQSLRNVERILFGDTSNASRTVGSIVGNFNNRVGESKVFNLFQETNRLKETYSALGKIEKQDQLYSFLEQIEKLLNEAEILYQGADEGRGHTESEIEKHTKEIQGLQTKILRAKEMIDDTFLAVDQLEVGVETAQKSLSLTQSQSTKSIDLAYNKVEVAQAEYQKALIKNGHVQVTSPFNGIVSAKFIEVGHMARPANALFEVMEVNTSLGQVASLEVKFGIPEELIGAVSIGDKVEVTLPMQENNSFSATINRKSSQIDRASNTAMVHAVLDNDTILMHNSNVYVHIQNTKNPVYEIPSYSIKKRRNQNFVFVKDWENYLKVAVEILAEDGEFSDIQSEGLSLESNVVIHPSVSLFQFSEN